MHTRGQHTGKTNKIQAVLNKMRNYSGLVG